MQYYLLIGDKIEDGKYKCSGFSTADQTNKQSVKIESETAPDPRLFFIIENKNGILTAQKRTSEDIEKEEIEASKKDAEKLIGKIYDGIKESLVSPQDGARYLSKMQEAQGVIDEQKTSFLLEPESNERNITIEKFAEIILKKGEALLKMLGQLEKIRYKYNDAISRKRSVETITEAIADAKAEMEAVLKI